MTRPAPVTPAFGGVTFAVPALAGGACGAARELPGGGDGTIPGGGAGLATPGLTRSVVEVTGTAM